ncbi:hypothetical protein BOSE21B_80049 [Bosea sp. 21B]|nr:hypothetical protein BOSE21B_80049 [Bosea sp. 21B]
MRSASRWKQRSKSPAKLGTAPRSSCSVGSTVIKCRRRHRPGNLTGGRPPPCGGRKPSLDPGTFSCDILAKLDAN